MDRRGKSWRALAAGPDEALEEPGPSEMEVEFLEGTRFDYAPEGRCKVCTADTRGLPNGATVHQLVDELMVKAATYSSIVEAIEPYMESWPPARRPGYASIRRHGLKHLRADQAAIREILERRATMADVRVVVGRGRVVTRAGLLELIRNRGFDALVTSEIVPSVRDAVEAAATLAEIDGEGSALQMEQVLEQLRLFATAVRRSVGEEQWDQIIGEVEHGASSSVAVLSRTPQTPTPPSLGAAGEGRSAQKPAGTARRSPRGGKR